MQPFIQISDRYFTVIGRSKEAYDNNEWAVFFGSWDKSDCVTEIEDNKRTDERNQERIQYKIIVTDGTQESINNAVAKLNY